jgi:hypothetical protein
MFYIVYIVADKTQTKSSKNLNQITNFEFL